MIEEVEELLEGYFMLLDNSWNKLRTLNQLIEDTEGEPRGGCVPQILHFRGCCMRQICMMSMYSLGIFTWYKTDLRGSLWGQVWHLVGSSNKLFTSPTN